MNIRVCATTGGIAAVRETALPERKECPFEMRAQAERWRRLDFPADLRDAVLEFVRELEALAAGLESSG